MQGGNDCHMNILFQVEQFLLSNVNSLPVFVLGILCIMEGLFRFELQIERSYFILAAGHKRLGSLT